MKVKIVNGKIKKEFPLQRGPFKRTWYSYDFTLSPTYIHISIDDESDDFFFSTCFDEKFPSVNYRLYGKNESLKILEMLEEIIDE